MNTLTAPNVIANTEQVRMLELLDTRLRWLSAWTIHNANHLRESRDGLKVGGHQASCASITTIMATLYFAGSCPAEWCTSGHSSRASPPGWAGHAAGKAGRLTMGSSLIGAIVSSVM